MAVLAAVKRPYSAAQRRGASLSSLMLALSSLGYLGMRKTGLVILVGTILSFLLASGGHWLIYSLVSGTHETYKDDYIEISIIQTLAILPLVFILIGALVGGSLPHRQGAAAGVSLLPFTLYLLYESRADVVLILLSLICLGLGIGTALLVGWLRSRKERSQQQNA